MNTKADSENDTTEVVSVFRSETYNPKNLELIFDPDFLEDLTIRLEEKTKGDNSISRADTAYEMGLTPYLKILPKNEEVELKSRCDKDFLESCAALHLIVKEGELVEEPKGEKKAQLENLRVLKKFDEFEIYRKARSANMAIEAIIGTLISYDIIPGFGLQKGPSGGIRRSENISVTKDRKPGAARVKSKYPNGFLETAGKALDTLLPIRAHIGVAPKYFKRGQILKKMGYDWVGGEFETMLSNAIGQNAIPGFDIAAGANKGVFRLAPGEAQKEKKAKKGTELPAVVNTVADENVSAVVETSAAVTENIVSESLPVVEKTNSAVKENEVVAAETDDDSMNASPDEEEDPIDEEVSVDSVEASAVI